MAMGWELLIMIEDADFGSTCANHLLGCKNRMKFFVKNYKKDIPT